MSATINPTTDRAAWLQERRKGIGASEAAMVVGCSPYGDQTTLALRKLGRLPEVEQTEQMELGLFLEPVLAELFQRRTGRTIEQTQVFCRCPLDPFLSATIDGVDSCLDLVEFKNVGAFSPEAAKLGEEGTNEIPAHWLTQAYQQMYCYGAGTVHFAVLVGGQSFRVYRVERNEPAIDAMAALLRRFWAKVERGEVPRGPFPVFNPAVLAALNPECEGTIVAGRSLAKKVEEFEALSARIKQNEEDQSQLKAEILRVMGTHEYAELPDGRRIKRHLIQAKERVTTFKAHTKHYFSIIKGA